MIHLTLAAYDRFAQTEVSVHHHLVEIAADRIDAEADAGDITLNHLLHDHGHGGQRVIESLLMSIGNRAVEPQGKETGFDLVQNLVRAGTVEISFVLTGKSGAGQVFHGRRRSDGERQMIGKAAELNLTSSMTAAGSESRPSASRSLALSARSSPAS